MFSVCFACRLFDAMEESVASRDTDLRKLVVECANDILDSLLSLVSNPTERQIADCFVQKINLLYLDMSSCDYIGK